MKKLAILMSAVVLGSLSALAQGNISFTDQGSGQLLSVDSGSGATLIGGNSTNSAALGAGPGQVRVELFLGTNGNAVTFNADGTPSNMVLVGTVTNLSSTAAGASGLFNGGSPYLLGSPFDGTFQVEYYYWAITLNGNYSGHSTLGTAYSLATGGNPVTATFGAGSPLVAGFTLTPVPEPGTILLGGLGAAGLLLFRRRKS